MIARMLAVALATFVPLVFVVNVMIEALPHARGIEWAPALRYAVVTPVCALVALAIATILCQFAPRYVAHLPGIGAWIAIGVFGVLELVLLRAAIASEPAPEEPTKSGFAFDVPRALFDVDHRRIDLPGAKAVHYVDEGQGPVLLFLHGNPSWSFQWRDLITSLRGSHRCIALDYPGFGLSPAPEGYGFTAREQSLILEQFVDALDLHDVTLVMQDWGGPIGLAFAGRRPERVRAIVAGNTWAWPTTTAEPRGKFSWLVGGPLGEFAQMNFNAFASFGLQHGVKHELAPDVLAMYLRPSAPLSGRGVAAFYPGQIVQADAFMREVEAGLPKLATKPALIFWGMQDQGFPRSDLDKMKAAFPQHRMVELPDADHFFFEDALEEMVPAIESFVSEHASVAR